MKTVYWRIDGGLGNQMFEYAFLYALLKNTGAAARIKCYKHYDENEDIRLYALDPFDISLRFSVKDEKKSANYYSWLLLKRKLLLKLSSRKSTEEQYALLQKNGIFYSNNEYVFDIENIRLKKKRYLVEGYYQSFYYFDKYKKDIQKEFTVIKDLSEGASAMHKEIESCTSVCVHIRRGDYLNSYYAPRFNLCDYTYYKKGMDYISSVVKDPVFYIFSNSHDDIEWIRKNYDFSGFNVKYVDVDGTDYEDLKLMTACKHFIISNSTYSWWGQYLAENEEKTVVSPKIWRRYGNQDFWLNMPEFHLIDVE